MNHFFDVGANVGQTFRDYLNPRPEYDGWDIWCFEPSPRHLPALMDEAKHQSSRYNVHVCPFGIRGSSRILPFYIKDDPRGDSFEDYLASDHETSNMDTGYELDVLSSGISATVLSASDYDDDIVLKLDCEGSEYDILASLIYRQEALSRIKKIFVEWHRIKDPARTAEDLSEAFNRIGKPLEQWMF